MQALPSEGSGELFCICRTPYDGSRFMIGCVLILRRPVRVCSVTGLRMHACLMIQAVFDACRDQRMCASRNWKNGIPTSPFKIWKWDETGRSETLIAPFAIAARPYPIRFISHHLSIHPSLFFPLTSISTFPTLLPIPSSPRLVPRRCDKCNGWFHAKCVNVTVNEAYRLKQFICPLCRKAGHTYSSGSSSNNGSGGVGAGMNNSSSSSDYVANNHNTQQQQHHYAAAMLQQQQQHQFGGMQIAANARRPNVGTGAYACTRMHAFCLCP